MTPALFDLPAPLLQWLDDRMTTIIPAPISVAIWAAVGAVACLELYRLVSPQRRIGQVKQDARQAQQELSAYDGEFEGAAPLIKRMLGLSLQRVAIVLPATLIAALPVIFLLVWLSNSYGHRFPALDEAVIVDVAAPVQARWISGIAPEPSHVQAFDNDGRILLDYPVLAAVPVLHKRIWWNWLIGNPAGYLPDDAPVGEMRLHLPRRQLWMFGPGWLRGWEAVFLPILFVVALAWKSARRID